MQLRVSQYLHDLTGRGFHRAGFAWEERRLGENRLGMWRIPLRRAMPPLPSRKRIVFLPGFGDTTLSWLGVWLALMPIVRRQYDELILLDFPGFGGFLSRDVPFASLDLMMKATGDLLDELRPDVLIGHSLGGWLAGYYAWECGKGVRPVRPGSRYAGPRILVPISAAGVAGSLAEREAFRAVFEKALAVGFSAIRPHVFGTEPRWFSFIAGEFEGFLEHPEISGFIRSATDAHNLEDKIPFIRARIRLIWGEIDSLTPASWLNVWMNAAVSETSGWTLPGTGHSPQIESPVMMTAALLRALGMEPTWPGLRRAAGRLVSVSRRDASN